MKRGIMGGGWEGIDTQTDGESGIENDFGITEGDIRQGWDG